MSAAAWAALAVALPFVVYACVRLAAAAWFKSKSQFDNHHRKG